MSLAHRAPYAVHQPDDFEPQPGLPALLPAGEALLWQGRPDTARVWRHVVHGRVVAAYFALLLAWQVAAAVGDGTAWADALRAAGRVLPLYLVALALLAALAAVLARTTVYTLTSERIVMRIGIVLTLTYNLPLRRIAAARLHELSDGYGDLALELEPGVRIPWLHLFPHARPWHLRSTQPMLRCLPDAAAVGERLHAAWMRATATPARG